MKRLSLVVVSLLALAVLAGCASSDTTARRSYVADEESARPGRIIVHDIAATPDDIPANAAVAGRYDQRDTPRTAGEIELGRQLGARVADGLDKEILDMGMPAERAGSGPPPQVGDVVIKGEPVS